MATSTVLLNAVTTNTTGTGVQLTGNVQFQGRGDAGGGVVEVQRALADSGAQYEPVGVNGQFQGEGDCHVESVAPMYYRGVLRGATRAAAYTLTAIHSDQ